VYPDNVPSLAVQNSAYVNVLHKNGFQCKCHGSCSCRLCPRGTYSRGDGVSLGCWQCPAGTKYKAHFVGMSDELVKYLYETLQTRKECIQHVVRVMAPGKYPGGKLQPSARQRCCNCSARRRETLRELDHICLVLEYRSNCLT